MQPNQTDSFSQKTCAQQIWNDFFLAPQQTIHTVQKKQQQDVGLQIFVCKKISTPTYWTSLVSGATQWQIDNDLSKVVQSQMILVGQIHHQCNFIVGDAVGKIATHRVANGTGRRQTMPQFFVKHQPFEVMSEPQSQSHTIQVLFWCNLQPYRSFCLIGQTIHHRQRECNWPKKALICL